MSTIHVAFPHPSLEAAWEANEWKTNATEPWTQQLLASLIHAYAARTVIEIGSHTGLTSAWLAMALQAQGGGKLIAVDVNQEYCEKTKERLERLPIPDVEVQIVNNTGIAAIEDLPRHAIDLAFVDFLSDGREIGAVLEKLWSWWDSEGLQRMNLGGLICVHDVSKDDVAQAVIGHHGYVLETARQHLHGGLGLIQVPLR